MTAHQEPMCLYLAAAMSTVHIGHMLDLYSMQEES